MARPLRIEYPGAFYHVTSRGNERKDIFRSQRDREKFLEYLGSATARYGARIHVYCLMSNHYHLLLETPLGNLSRIMSHVNGAYTTYFNIKRNRSGHLVQGRYKAILVEKEEYAEELSRYIHLNPVRVGMVEAPARYSWSSYAAYAGLADSPGWLERDFILAHFGSEEKKAQCRYREFVEGMCGKEYPDPLKEVVGSTLLGTQGFVEWVKEEFLKGRAADRGLPALRHFSERPTVEGVWAVAQERFAEDQRTARRVALYLCHRYTGSKLREIGRVFGVGESAVSEASRRVNTELKRDQRLRDVVRELEEKRSV